MKVNLNKLLFYFLQFVGYLGLFFILFNASVNMLVYPFAFGMLFALTWANQKVWILAPAYLVAGIVLNPTFEGAICLMTCLFFLVVPYFVHVLCKKNMQKWEFIVFAMLSQVANIVFDILAGFSPFLSATTLLLGVLFMLSCMNVFEALIIRGFTNRLTTLEIVSLFSIIACLCGGLVVLNIGAFSFLKLFMCFVLLLFAYCSTPLLTLLVASIGGIGSLIATNNPFFIAPFVIWALVILLFKNRLKIFSIIALICVELLIGYYFRLYPTFGYVEILPVVISSIAFIALPNKFVDDLAVMFKLSKDRLAMKNVVNRNRELLHRRLGNLSEVFNDINIIYRNFLKAGMTLDEVKELLNQEISSKICSFCPERSHCHRTFADSTRKVFDELITISFEKGKATILDIPSYLTSRCKQTSPILGAINSLTAQYKKYMSMVHDVDTSKLIIADQLFGVSKILKSLSEEVESNISFDTARENKIMDELTYYNIVCIDVVVFEKDVWTTSVSVVVRNEDAQKQRIADVVSKICGQKMEIYETFPSSRPSFVVVNLKSAPKYDCIFGVSQKTKNGSKVSGDTYSIIRLDGDRILFTINDGMGSGHQAESASEMSISLVENFYKAGFDNEIILSTVNKLLALHKDEIFSALDICIFDEKNGMVDFIKMASPNSFILNEDACQTIEAGALPIGIVEESKPLINKHVVSEKDFLILLSDGVSDSFKTDEELRECVKSIKTKNPQEFADELLYQALSSNNGYAVDDMTIIVVKVLNS